MSEGGIPEPRSDSGLKKEDSDDPLRWATSESFTFESDSVLAGGTSATAEPRESELEADFEDGGGLCTKSPGEDDPGAPNLVDDEDPTGISMDEENVPSSPIGEPSDNLEAIKDETDSDDSEKMFESVGSHVKELKASMLLLHGTEEKGNRKREPKTKCFVATCLHRHRVNGKASFHKWPKNDPQTKSAWVSACGRQDVVLTDNQGICGLHFENSCFVGSEMMNLGIEMKTTPKRKALKEGAIPTLNLTCPIEDYVIRSMKRVTIKAPDGEVIPTNKIRVEVGPAYEHLMRTIKDPQLIHITANVVVARPHISKRATSLQNHLVKSEFICRVRQCPFQDEKAFMFCFPENEHLRVEWARVCDLSRSNTSDNTDRNCWVPRVCSYHFDKTDWTLTPTGFRDLKSDARPRLHLPDRAPAAVHPSSVGSLKQASVCLDRLDGSGDEENRRLIEAAAARPLSVQEQASLTNLQEDDLRASTLAPKKPSQKRVRKFTTEFTEAEDQHFRVLERKQMVEKLVKDSDKDSLTIGKVVKPRLQRDVRSKYARMDPEVFDNVESAYEALGHGPSSSIGNLRNKQTKSFAAQVDFPDGCNLLVYQCVKQLRNALAAKDEEIKHLRLLVHHLSTELKEKKDTMVLATPFLISNQDEFEAQLPEFQRYWFNDQSSRVGNRKSSSSNDNEDESGTIVNQEQEGQSASSNGLKESGGPGRTGRPKKHAFLNMVSENKAIRTMCCVPGCQSPVTAAYHKFPNQFSPYHQIWMEKCLGSTDTEKDMGQATVCSEHFDEDCFDIEVTMNDENTETRTRSILKEDAIPTLKLNQFAKL